MLRRMYADNFRCLVNFELELDPVTLLVGENGSGKTTVFDLLYRLQRFIVGDARAAELFRNADLTSWQTNAVQRFEVDLEIGQDAYRYALAIEHDEARRWTRVSSETLTLGQKNLLEFRDGTAQLYHDDFSEGPRIPFDVPQSALSMLRSGPDDRKLDLFRKELQKLIIVRLNPGLMIPESRKEEPTLDSIGGNFVNWYRFLWQEHTSGMLATFPALQRVLPGFRACNLKEAGEARVMKVLFERPGKGGRDIPYDFEDLSDGQRVLIVLYTMLYGLKDEGPSLFIDEPDNFVALREIQPWLTALTDSVGEGIEQAVLISHHPEIINYLGASSGRWFERESNAPARVSDKPKAAAEGLTLAETIARGWEK